MPPALDLATTAPAYPDLVVPRHLRTTILSVTWPRGVDSLRK
jgi:hypothetical protein